MKITKRIGILTILLILTISVFNISSVNAASTTLKASNVTVKSGETFSVTISSSIKLTGWTISLTNNGGCTFSSASGGEVTGTTVYGTDLSGKTSLATYKFKAPTVTKDTKYTISFSGTAMCDVDTNELSNTTCKATITVKANTTTTTNKNTSTTNKDTSNTTKNETTTTTKKSSNAYLSTLGVRISDSLAKELGVKADEYDFSGFSKTKTSYNVTVPKNVDSLKVIATAGENGTVKVSGNSGFEVGSNNKITIKVTSEDGKATKTYTIKVTKLAEEEEKPGNLIEDDEGIYLKELSVEGINLSPEFSKDTYSYTAALSDSTVSEVKVNAVANNEKAKIDISGNTELVEGENTINIVVTVEDSTEQTVYQIVVTKEATQSIAATTSENTPTSTTDLIGTIKNYAVIAIAVVVLMIVAVIVLVILLRRENKRLREEDTENLEETKSEEYNVYKNDENEFENNNMEKDNFIESLYKQRNGSFEEEELDEQERETLEEISKQTAEIFKEKEVEGQSVEYSPTEFYDENPLEQRRKRRGKGKHSL